MAQRRARSVRAAPAFVPPYPPSWFDRLKSVIERLPGPWWLPYPVVWLAVYAVETALHWQAGAYPVGTWNGLHGMLTAIVPLTLAMLHGLDRRAGRSFDSFRPVVHGGDEDARRLRYRLTTMPRRDSLFVAVGFIGFGAAVAARFDGGATSSAGLPEMFGAMQLSLAPAAAAFSVLVMTATWASVGTTIYHTVRQLALVSQIYTRHTRVDVLTPGPLYALSRVTAGTAIAMVLISYGILAADRRFFNDPRNFIGAGVFGLLAILAFVLPLLGIHRILEAEKERRVGESAERMRAALDDLHQRVDRKRLGDMDALHKAIASLEVERNLLSRFPTWPWQPETLRTVVAALVFPLVLWVAQALLGRALGA